jgi:hypothetical protein
VVWFGGGEGRREGEIKREIEYTQTKWRGGSFMN